MIYKEYQGMKLSQLGFGAMRLPVIDGVDANVDEAATEKMVDRAGQQTPATRQPQTPATRCPTRKVVI